MVFYDSRCSESWRKHAREEEIENVRTDKQLTGETQEEGLGSRDGAGAHFLDFNSSRG